MAGRPNGTGGKAEELTADEIKRIDKCLKNTRHEHRNRALLFVDPEEHPGNAAGMMR